MRMAIKLRRLLPTFELQYAPLYYKMPFTPCGALHSARLLLNGQLSLWEQWICKYCCRHLLCNTAPLARTITCVGYRAVFIKTQLRAIRGARLPPLRRPSIKKPRTQHIFAVCVFFQGVFFLLTSGL